MALLRSCGRLVQAFGKLPVSCQVEYTRGVERVARTQSYVTVAPKLGNSISSSEKLEVPSSNLNASDITSPSLTTNLQQKLVSLCFNAKNGTIRSEEMWQILESYTGSEGTVDSSGLFVLSSCGNMLPYVNAANRRIITSHIWKILSRDASVLTLEHYNTLLNIHDQNDQPVEPKQFVDDMIVKPDSTTYKLLLKIVARCGNIESVLYILSRMKNEDQPLNEGIFNLLILAHGSNKDIKTALSTLDIMKNVKIEPNVETYANIACAYASVADIDNTMKILNSYPLNVAQIMEIVKRLSSSNLGKHIPDVLKYLPLPVNANNAIFLNTIMELTHNGRPEDAFEVINCLTPAVSTDEKNPIFGLFLKDMVQAKIPSSTILKFMNMLMTVKNYPPAIIDVCEGALYSGECELAMAIFEVMHERTMKVRPHYYWPLLIQASRSRGETDVFRILKHMLGLKVVLDYDTLFCYVLPYINIIDPFITLRKFGDLGLEVSVVLTPLICYLLSQQKIKKALTLCSRIIGSLDFDKVLSHLVPAYRRSKNINDCVKMFIYAPPEKFYPEEFLLILFGKTTSGRNAVLLNKFLQAFEAMKIPVSDFTTVEDTEIEKVDGCSEVTLVNPLDSVRPFLHVGNRIPHPKDMNLEDLECHLIELKAKRMNIRGILRKLLQFHCRENNLNRAEEIKIEYDENDFLWTPGMYSSLLQLYVQNGRVEEAMTLYSKIKDYKDFKIDHLKIIDLATALVNTNMISEAFTILKSTTMTVDPRLTKNCWQLLDAVAHSSNYELTESMLEVLVNAGFCVRNNAMMGPLVRVHLLRDDLASAVDTFVKCAKRYRRTPLHQELVSALVKSMNTNKSAKDEMMKLLLEVQSITTKIHDSDNAKMDLFLALARHQMTDELRKFLKNNELPSHFLSKSLTLVSKDQTLPILTTLLDASTEISNINRSFIYEKILSVHSRSGDCEKAIELWKRFSAEDEHVPQAFKTVFVSLLTNHKVPLPEDFPDTRVDE